MDTSLSIQLRGIAHASAPDHLAPKARRSVLFDRDLVHDLDRDGIRKIASAACKELAAVEPRLLSYHKLLFGKGDGVGSDNNDKKAEEKKISEFLRLLSPLYVRTTTDKVLEHLVRSKEAWFRCPDDILACVLPYHDTDRFVSVLRTLDLSNSSWKCLRQTQRNRVGLSRDRIVRYAVQDPAVFKFLCQEAKASAKIARPGHANVSSFYAIVLVESVREMPTETMGTMQTVQRVIHYVAKTLEQKKNAPESFAGAYMVVAQLVSKTILTKEAVNVLLEIVSKTVPQTLQPHALYLIAHIAHTQGGDLVSLPDKAFNHLVKFQDIAELLHDLRREAKKSCALIRMFLCSLLVTSPNNRRHADLMLQMIRTQDCAAFVKPLMESIATRVSFGGEGGPDGEFYRELLLDLQNRYPVQTDHALNTILNEADGRESLRDFFAAMFRGGMLEPMPDTNMSALAALGSPDGKIRAAGLRRIDADAAETCDQPRMQEIISDAVLKSLRDEEHEVLGAALSCRCLSKLDGVLVFKMLKDRLLLKTAELQGSKSIHPAQDRKVCKRIVSFLAEEFLPEHQELRTDILALLLHHCIVRSHTTKLNLTCISLVVAVEPGLRELSICIPEKLDKESSQGTHEVNQALLLALARTRYFEENFRRLYEVGTQDKLCSLEFLVVACLIVYLENRAVFESAESSVASTCFEIIWSIQKLVHLKNKLPGEGLAWQKGLPPQRFWESDGMGPGLLRFVLWKELSLSFLKSIPRQSFAWDSPFYQTTLQQCFLTFLSSNSTADFAEHLEALYLIAKESRELLLCNLVTLDPRDASPLVRARALDILNGFLQESCTTMKTDENGTILKQALPALLAALCAPEQSVRSKALEGCRVMSDLVGLPRKARAKKATPESEFLEVLRKIAEKRTDILHDPEGLEKLLRKKDIVVGQKTAQLVVSTAITSGSYHYQKTLVRLARSMLQECEILVATNKLFTRLCADAVGDKCKSWGLFKELLELHKFEVVSSLEATKREQHHLDLLAASRLPEAVEDMHATECRRYAALRVLTPHYFSSLSFMHQQGLLLNLLRTSSRDPSERCRLLSHELLLQYDLSPRLVLSMFGCHGPEQESVSHKKKRQAAYGSTDDSLEWDPKSIAQDLDSLATMLEIVRQKHFTQDQLTEIVKGVCALIKFLAKALSTGATSEGSTDLGMQADYCITLCISFLQSYVESGKSDPVDVGIVLYCAEHTLDKSLRRSCLKLLATVTAQDHARGLEYVLDALRVASASLGEDDNTSYEVAFMVLSAAIPADNSNEKNTSNIIEVILDSICSIPDHRRRHVFKALWFAVRTEKRRAIVLETFFDKKFSSKDAWSWDTSALFEDLDPLEVSKALISFSFSTREDIQVVEEVASILLICLHTLSSVEHPLSGSFEGRKEFVELVLQFCISSLHMLRTNRPELEAEREMAANRTLGHQLWSIVSALSTLATPSEFFMSLLFIMNEQSCPVKITALSILEETLEVVGSDAALANGAETSLPVLVSEALNNVLLEGHGGAEEYALQFRVLSVAKTLIAQYGELHQLVSLRIFPGALTMASSESVQVSTAAIECIAFAFEKASRKLIPKLPEVVPKLLEQMEKTVQEVSKKKGEQNPMSTAKAIALLQVLETCILQLGSFLSPYIAKLIEFLLDPLLAQNKDGRIASMASRLLETIPNHVPARVALVPILGMFTTALNHGEKSLLTYFDLLEHVVRKLDKHSLDAQHVDVFACLQECFQSIRGENCSANHLEALEERCAFVFLALVRRLNDSQFTPILERLLDWAEAKDATADYVQVQIVRHTTLFHVVSILSTGLKTAFAPYFAVLFSRILQILESVGDDNHRHEKRRKRLSSESNGKWPLYFYGISALRNCFLSDEGAVINQERYESVMPLLVSFCSSMPKTPHMHGISTEQMEDALSSCIAELAVLMGEDSLWKPMNHKLLMCTRNEQPYTRMLALKCIKQLVERLQEEYLIFLPETLPFLAELLEDSHREVESMSRQVILHLEQISGEDLEQYLKIN